MPSELQNITLPKKRPDQNILNKGPKLYTVIKNCWSPHFAEAEVWAQRKWKLTSLETAVLRLSDLCVRGREKGQMANLYMCPTGRLVKGSLAQRDCSMKASPCQRCCMTFIQKENVALALNSLMILFKVLALATCPISVITLFWLLWRNNCNYLNR